MAYYVEDTQHGIFGWMVEVAPHHFINTTSAVKLRIPIAGKVYARISTLEKACLAACAPDLRVAA